MGCGLLLEIAAGTPPESEIADEEGAVGSMANGEVYEATSFVVLASVEPA